jgi:hypothetical protein
MVSRQYIFSTSFGWRSQYDNDFTCSGPSKNTFRCNSHPKASQKNTGLEITNGLQFHEPTSIFPQFQTDEAIPLRHKGEHNHHGSRTQNPKRRIFFSYTPYGTSPFASEGVMYHSTLREFAPTTKAQSLPRQLQFLCKQCTHISLAKSAS